jgi:hypothetical protein
MYSSRFGHERCTSGNVPDDRQIKMTTKVVRTLASDDQPRRLSVKSCFVHCSEDKPIQKAGAWRTALSIALR